MLWDISDRAYWSLRLRLLSWLLPDAYQYVTEQIRLDNIENAIADLQDAKADISR